MRVNHLPLGFMMLCVSPLSAQTVFAAPEPPDPPMLMAFRGAVGGQSFLGVGVAEIDSTRAKDLKLRDVYGIEITRIETDSAAAKAGLKVGDAVLGYNGQRIEGYEQFLRFVRETPPGREVKMTISRSGAEQTIPVVMGSHKMVPGDHNEALLNLREFQMPEMPRVFTTWSSSMLGIEAESLTHQLAEFFGAKEGVLVRSVVKDSAAEKAGIKAGDVIVKVDQTGVLNPSEVTSAVRSARAKKTFPVELIRDKHETTVTVTMEGDQSTVPRIRLNGRSVKM